ncbi:MAG TPA: hypothetical protein VFB38_03280 [Chthonomonadaceae bacterium]|nr:hypothetical protein [Chthonomonadaceae bacterium]
MKRLVKNIPVPVIVGVVIVAIAILIFSIARSMRTDTGVPTPATPLPPTTGKMQGPPPTNMPPAAMRMRGMAPPSGAQGGGAGGP